jgi:hypothetical protein
MKILRLTSSLLCALTCAFLTLKGWFHFFHSEGRAVIICWLLAIILGVTGMFLLNWQSRIDREAARKKYPRAWR